MTPRNHKALQSVANSPSPGSVMALSSLSHTTGGRVSERGRGLLLALVLVSGCSQLTEGPPLSRVSAESHPYFPIAPSLDAGHSIGRGTLLDGTFTCDSCHPATAPSFKDFTCTTCHPHEPRIDVMLHRGVEDAGTSSAACYACHPTGEQEGYTHAGIVAGECATCHDVQTAFARLPKEGFTHRDVGGVDCGGCHVTTSWKEVNGAPDGVFDPMKSFTVNTLLPTFSGPFIASVRPNAELLQFPMKHSTSTIDGGVMQACVSCHSEAATNVFYPGTLHSSLANLGEPQPARCGECHDRNPSPFAMTDAGVGTRPTGFVGPLNGSRSPATGPMRHEAVAWTNGAPSATPLVTADCSTCHFAPGVNEAFWSTGATDAGVRFHASLTAASLPQPTSCIDCHANTRPTALLTSMNAAVPPGLTFDHQSQVLLGDCAGCHASTSVWSGARFHPVGAQTPTTCLPCHAAERPTSTATWMQPGYQNRPFDYVTNDAGVTHGAGEDCVVCHNGPGSGAWGTNQNWQRGTFPHGPNTIAASTCLTCHTTQRPDLLSGTTPAAMATLLGFDHSINGTGECGACHQATVMRGQYTSFFNPMGVLPGGDWRGGTSYPGDFLVTSPNRFVSLTTLRLQRATPMGLVTGMTTQSVTLPNAMKHTSNAIPMQLHPGPAATPNNATCWHCHTNTNGTVTAFANGFFHAALTNYRASPDAGVTALPQPTGNCRDCHATMLPPDVVQRMSNPLFSMDHRARFVSAVMIGGQSVSSVDAIDCSRCHATTGTAWTDGRFHSNIAAATPQDCTVCHYPLMASAAADVTTMTRFTMKHRSGQMTTQSCQTCHTMSLTRATMMPTAANLWNPGQYHPFATTQPALCLDCHSLSEPAAATQGTESYSFTMGGGSTTNSLQWMNHTMSAVVGRDCSVCHAADARTMGSAWSKATVLHSRAPNLTQCSICHGTANGRGAVLGTNNNLPSGATNSATVTASSVSPGVRAQMNHADLNATSHDCNFCHTQQGSSTAAGIMGREWAQARFHTRFTAAQPLVMNGTTARCSNCHINEKPGASFTMFDHAAYTAAQTTSDCGTCHSYPGDMAAPPLPNWKGARAMPTIISVGGFVIPVPPATTANTIQQGIANLPHPPASGIACTTCHTQASGGRRAFGYPHASTTLINNNCNSCHEAGSDLVGTVWNNATTSSAGAGDTRPFTLTSVVPTFKGNTRACGYPKHFFPIDCKECHRIPAGNGFVTTGAAYLAAWRFSHTESRMTRPGTCNTCHAGTCNLPD